MAWGRITEQGMPFNQMMLFPTEFKLVTTKDGLRMEATPIKEIERLHLREHAWSSISAADANCNLSRLGPVPLHVKIRVNLEKHDELDLRYQGTELGTVQSAELENGRGLVEVLVDKGVAEIFIAGAPRYEIKEIPTSASSIGLELGLRQGTGIIDHLEVYEMKSMWDK